jgi:CheY-like chemotaxis protein
VSSPVLIVEDDPELLEGLADLLEAEGYRVRRARHGLEALGILRAGPLPRLILLDLLMPIMNGWQFRYQQRLDSELARIPLIVLSGRDEKSAHAEWLEADDYLVKPVQPEVLLEAVGRLCRSPDHPPGRPGDAGKDRSP